MCQLPGATSGIAVTNVCVVFGCSVNVLSSLATGHGATHCGIDDQVSRFLSASGVTSAIAGAARAAVARTAAKMVLDLRIEGTPPCGSVRCASRQLEEIHVRDGVCREDRLPPQQDPCVRRERRRA